MTASHPIEDSFSDRDVVSLFANDNDVHWFLDANMILHANVSRITGTGAKLFTTPRIVSEVRQEKHNSNRGANELVDSIESAGGVVDTEYFFTCLENYRFLLQCAETLTPIARMYIKEFGEDESERAIQFAANEGGFFETDVISPLAKQLQDDDLLSGKYIGLHAKIQKAWFSYHGKRRKKIAEDQYIAADEQLVAAATCNSLVMKRKTVVLSNDRDLAAIVKNLRDNVLWAYSKGVCIDRGVDINETAREVFDQCCSWLKEYEQTESILIGINLTAGQLPVYWQNINHLNRYLFTPFFIDFISQRMPAEFTQPKMVAKLLGV